MSHPTALRAVALTLAALLSAPREVSTLLASSPRGKEVAAPAAASQWRGKRVAFLGDSITDKGHVGTKRNYWQYLAEWLGLTPLVYGINGNQWSDVEAQARRLEAECGDSVDAVVILAGTNDYNASVPMGEWYDVRREQVAVGGGRSETRARRSPAVDDTFRGRVNRAMDFIKSHFPEQQVILVTPLHRGYATFGPDNVQPEETFANGAGLYIGDYARAVREAGDVWAVPVIDLFAASGLYPVNPAHTRYVHKADTDRLHPNTEGHRRMALTLMYQMLALPATFR